MDAALVEPPVSSDVYIPSEPSSIISGLYSGHAQITQFQSASLSGTYQYLRGVVDGVSYAGSAGLSSAGTAFTAGNIGTPGNVAFLQGGGSSISATLSDFSEGVSYTFSFLAAQRLGNRQDVQVLLDGRPLGTIKPHSDGTYTEITTQSVSPGTGSHTLTFVGIDSAGGDRGAPGYLNSGLRFQSE